MLLRSTLKFVFGTSLSRLTGIARDVVLAGVFGASPLMEAFLLANRIPNLFRDMLAEGALGSAFTKTYSALMVTNPEKSKILRQQMLVLGFYFFVVLSILGWIFAPALVRIMTLTDSSGARSPDFIRETVALTRVLFPFLGLAILASLAGGVLQAHKRFFASSVSSSFLNVGYLLGATILATAFVQYLPQEFDTEFCDRRIFGLAVGVVIGGGLHFVSQLLLLPKDPASNKKIKLSEKLRILRITPEIKSIFTLMFPAAIAASAGVINMTVSTNFATSLESGTITWLNYAFRLLQVPVGVFGVAVGSVVLPSLTKKIQLANKRCSDEVCAELQRACEMVVWLMTPCLIIIVWFSTDICTFFFRHGNFTEYDSMQTSLALQIYGVGAISYGLIKVLTSFYFAIDKTSFAMKISFAMVAINFLLCYFLTEKYAFQGLATATTVLLLLNTAALLVGSTFFGMRWNIRSATSTILAIGTTCIIAWVFYNNVTVLPQVWLEGVAVYGPKFLAFVKLAIASLGIGAAFAIAASLRYGTNKIFKRANL